MPRSTNTWFSRCPQKRHCGGLAGSEAGDGECFVMWRRRCVTWIELCRVPEVREPTASSIGKQHTLRAAAPKGRYVRKSWASAARIVALPLFATALAGCNGPGPATVEIRAEPAIIAPGETFRLSWRSVEVAGCK